MTPEEKLSRLGLFLSCAFGFAAVSARAVTVDYNSAGDLNANFAFNDEGVGNKYSEVASGGLGGSRAVDIGPAFDATHTTAVYDQGSFDFSTTGDGVTVSQFFLRQDATSLITNFSIMQAGILTDNTKLFGSNNVGNSYATLRLLSSTANNTDVFLQTEVKEGTGTRQQGTVPGTASLVAGDWYRFEATIENLSSSQVRMTGSLEDWGTSGSSLVGTVLSLTASDSQSLVSLSGADIVQGDSAVWAGYRSFGEGGANLLDNFSAVPEPATLALVGLVGLILGRRFRVVRKT